MNVRVCGGTASVIVCPAPSVGFSSRREKLCSGFLVSLSVVKMWN